MAGEPCERLCTRLLLFGAAAQRALVLAAVAAVAGALGGGGEELGLAAAVLLAIALWCQLRLHHCAAAVVRALPPPPAGRSAAARAAQRLEAAQRGPSPRSALQPAAAAAAAPEGGRRVPPDFAESCCERTLVAKPNIVSGYELSERDLEILGRGDALFGFLCKPGHSLAPAEWALFRPMINLSAFADEAAENQAPHIDSDSLTQFTFFLTRSMYVIPGVRVEDVTVQMLSSVEYHLACQPGRTRVWEDVHMMPPNTFRITKTLVRFIFDVTVQLRVSEVPQEHLSELCPLIGGLCVDRALLLERTYRPGEGPVDGLRKVKSLLLFHRLPRGDGFLWSNPTAMAIGNIPGPIASIVNTCGSMGSAEVAETATVTRRYFARPEVMQRVRRARQPGQPSEGPRPRA
eukprot:TRINITY_DN25461_c0_g1_i1.p1 TRINITY_DN25461_c0_g1~~TRINITY_DN25461_c0_g1_i1.p1  ORF type:complete len:430 (+),score=131.73 TRINITY_DN25461_c0_g1_i1:80-1291(+)